MLTANDVPTIRNAIEKRLDKEPGVKFAQVYCAPIEGAIAVYVEMVVGGELEVQSRFDLPDPFEHSHLLNEVDEIAEHCKQARLQYWQAGRQMSGRQELPGTGLRGRWARYG